MSRTLLKSASQSPRTPPKPAGEAWAIVVQLFKNAKADVLKDFDLTPAQAHLLMQLDPEHPVPMSDVATTLGCDASNVTGLVDRLESQSLIERRAATADRRVKMVAVTTKGTKLRGKLLDRWFEPPPAIAALTLTDQKALLRILRKAEAHE